MNPTTKHHLKVFFKYLFLEPFTEKVSLPNIRTIFWILSIVFLLTGIYSLLLISLFIGLILHAVREYKSGKHMQWYRNRNYPEFKEAMRKIRERKRQENGKTGNN